MGVVSLKYGHVCLIAHLHYCIVENQWSKSVLGFLHQVALGNIGEVKKIASSRRQLVNFKDYDRRSEFEPNLDNSNNLIWNSTSMFLSLFNSPIAHRRVRGTSIHMPNIGPRRCTNQS